MPDWEILYTFVFVFFFCLSVFLSSVVSYIRFFSESPG